MADPDDRENMVLRTVYLPRSLDSRLRALAFTLGQSKAAFMRELLAEALDRRKSEGQESWAESTRLIPMSSESKIVVIRDGEGSGAPHGEVSPPHQDPGPIKPSTGAGIPQRYLMRRSSSDGIVISRPIVPVSTTNVSPSPQSVREAIASGPAEGVASRPSGPAAIFNEMHGYGTTMAVQLAIGEPPGTAKP